MQSVFIITIRLHRFFDFLTEQTPDYFSMLHAIDVRVSYIYYQFGKDDEGIMAFTLRLSHEMALVRDIMLIRYKIFENKT